MEEEAQQRNLSKYLPRQIFWQILKTTGTHREKHSKFSCPETAGSQIRVKNASAVSSELGRSLMLPGFTLTLPAHYKNPAFTFTIYFCLPLLSSCTPNFLSKFLSFSVANGNIIFIRRRPTLQIQKRSS
ncbi:hypothetical protein V6N12_028684 [Hibiscus sabdariffa]|uniref:Uncharacterized protein n=1 Tax=Hibiscus sabdariffa TaxID=183260 RepID=A0ABR2F6J4_9ROSI